MRLPILLSTLVGIIGCTTVPSEHAVIDAGCSSCEGAQGCDADSGACATLLPVAAACGTLPDGGEVEGRCAAGLSCGSVGAAVARCTKDCTANEGCTEGRTCLARTVAGAPSFCGALARLGERCDAASLIFCSGRAECVAPSTDETLGKCFGNCDAINPDCAPGESCADLFPDNPTLGICVTPAGAHPNKCDHSQLVFCGRGELCVRPTAAMWGYCHPRCTVDKDCGSGRQCLSPVSGISFCVAPVALCANQDAGLCETCAGDQDRFCAKADLCVRLDTVTVCKVDCSATGQCEAGTCKPLGTSGSSACL